MSSKYQGLPDIVGHVYGIGSEADMQDTAPDIFETSDEPERLLAPVSWPVPCRYDELMVQSDGISEDDAAPKKVTEGIDINGLPDRSRAQQIFGRTSKSSGWTSTGPNQSGLLLTLVRAAIPPSSPSYTHSGLGVRD
jgi:nuclear migration protein JNM1